MPYADLAVIFVLILLNGFFAMSELAIVSSRRPRLQQMEKKGSRGAAKALALAEDPTSFLSTVQIGITLIGILAGAFGGATLSESVAPYVAQIPSLAPYAKPLAIFLVVGMITYFSLIIGELVPKRVALSNPEGRAMLVARPMTGLARLAAPFVWFLTVSTNVVLKIFGLGKEVEAPPSEEEVTHMIEQGTTAGVFHKSERAMVEGVLRLDERPVTEIMTRRAQIVWLNVNDPDDVNWRKIVASGHSQFPVYEGTRDNVLGMVAVKALWANAAAGVPNSIRNHVIVPLFVPKTIHVTQLLEQFQKSGKHLALVTDEYGSVQGLVTLIDVMEAIVGELPEPGDRPQPEITQREDGSWLIDGGLPIGEFRRKFSLPPLPGEEEADFETLGGFVVDQLGRIPKAGDHFMWDGRRLEVVDMDRHRVDKVLFHNESTETT